MARGNVGRRRILGGQEVNCYYVMSRTAGGDLRFVAEEKDAFLAIMRRIERFAGVEILTYTVMDHQFQLLVRVPNRGQFLARFEGPDGDENLLEHLKLVYSPAFLSHLRLRLEDLKERGLEQDAQQLRQRFKNRFCRLGPFMKELKERYSRWFNKHHHRRGPLWKDRYTSLIIEDDNALLDMAVDIDMSPVLAGICEDPKDYSWCGFAEALGGSKRARRGLCRAMNRPLDSWSTEAPKASSTGAKKYRALLNARKRKLAGKAHE